MLQACAGAPTPKSRQHFRPDLLWHYRCAGPILTRVQLKESVLSTSHMSASPVKTRIAEWSPRPLARMAGALQLLEGLTATFGQVIVLNRLVVSHNAAATAANILGHERLFWAGFASSLIGVVFHIAWALLIYELLKYVNRRVALFATFVILVGCAVQALTVLFYIAPLLVLRGGSSFTAFSADQLQGMALLALRLNGSAFNIYLVFFGLWCFLVGFLIFRANFLPRILGVLLAISGVGWMLYLWPPLAQRLFMPYIAGASAIGEIPLELWLLVMAVNAQKWQEQARAAGGSE